MAPTSTAPSTAQQIALRRSPASQYPVAALKQRIALVHPLAHAAGLLSIFRKFIETYYPRQLQTYVGLRTFYSMGDTQSTDGSVPPHGCSHNSSLPEAD
jgi:hypothetical protein